jgi:hypothetical protein
MKKPTIEERTTDILNDESFEEVVMDTGWEELAPYVIDGPYVADENLFDVHSYDFAVSIEN